LRKFANKRWLKCNLPQRKPIRMLNSDPVG
jgi:hypothetical protein